ncbi:MAG: HIT family protein [Phycisphaerae bacterium]|nr:HIT family protein [Phycisphaerae bacterium]NUQ44650.1 HIT family protein [Phycisphaerae bacterium]
MSTSSSDCIFCKIASGAIPSASVHEDADCLAFLDIAPLSEGHTLLIPKRHVARIEEMSGEDVARLTRHLPRLAEAIRSAVGATGLNILQNNGRESGQAVFHVHFHLIPRRADDGLGYRWNAGKYAEGRAEQIRAAIRSRL